jgi:23S rRNA (uracil1939-C5)-methyltransferase
LNAKKVPGTVFRWNVFGYGDLLLEEGGVERGEIILKDKKITVDAKCFFQSNVEALKELTAELLEKVSRVPARASVSSKVNEAGSHILDLYCGVGTFSVFLKDLFSGLDLVEENKTALALAVSNVGNGRECQFFAESCEDFVARHWKDKRYDAVLCDPPRTGLSPAVADALVQHRPNRIAYVSCNPATLARDAKKLAQGGCTLESLSLHDFYPQTSHIETLAVFAIQKEI